MQRHTDWYGCTSAESRDHTLFWRNDCTNWSLFLESVSAAWPWLWVELYHSLTPAQISACLLGPADGLRSWSNPIFKSNQSGPAFCAARCSKAWLTNRVIIVFLSGIRLRRSLHIWKHCFWQYSNLPVMVEDLASALAQPSDHHKWPL